MIGKAGLGSYAKGILEYCYYQKGQQTTASEQSKQQSVRGELVYIQNLALKTGPDGTLCLQLDAFLMLTARMNGIRFWKTGSSMV
ncbi:hypothetical protein ACN9ML_14105 [Dyadobacter endophyticus]|uniref:hypothetical protein n=1 Tax=Dyadobacter endophyticus TaxID=1749036 RepID=UPI003CF3B440